MLAMIRLYAIYEELCYTYVNQLDSPSITISVNDQEKNEGFVWKTEVACNHDALSPLTVPGGQNLPFYLFFFFFFFFFLSPYVVA